jgi:hypothetical protein
MFEEALEMSHENVLRTLEVMWRRFIDKPSNYVGSRPVTQADFMGVNGRTNSSNGSMLTSTNDGLVPSSGIHKTLLGTNREFFVNMRTMISQWTRPFWPRTFRQQDIDMDIFVQILIRYDVFPRSPFLEVLNITPQDLWPNSETFYKQIKEKEKALQCRK